MQQRLVRNLTARHLDVMVDGVVHVLQPGETVWPARRADLAYAQHPMQVQLDVFDTTPKADPVQQPARSEFDDINDREAHPGRQRPPVDPIDHAVPVDTDTPVLEHSKHDVRVPQPSEPLPPTPPVDPLPGTGSRQSRNAPRTPRAKREPKVKPLA